MSAGLPPGACVQERERRGSAAAAAAELLACGAGGSPTVAGLHGGAYRLMVCPGRLVAGGQREKAAQAACGSCAIASMAASDSASGKPECTVWMLPRCRRWYIKLFDGLETNVSLHALIIEKLSKLRRGRRQLGSRAGCLDSRDTRNAMPGLWHQLRCRRTALFPEIMGVRAVWASTLLCIALSLLPTSAAAPRQFKRSIQHGLHAHEPGHLPDAASGEKHAIIGSVIVRDGKFSFERDNAAGI